MPVRFMKSLSPSPFQILYIQYYIYNRYYIFDIHQYSLYIYVFTTTYSRHPSTCLWPGVRSLPAAHHMERLWHDTGRLGKQRFQFTRVDFQAYAIHVYIYSYRSMCITCGIGHGSMFSCFDLRMPIHLCIHMDVIHADLFPNRRWTIWSSSQVSATSADRWKRPSTQMSGLISKTIQFQRIRRGQTTWISTVLLVLRFCGSIWHVLFPNGRCSTGGLSRLRGSQVETMCLYQVVIPSRYQPAFSHP